MKICILAERFGSEIRTNAKPRNVIGYVTYDSTQTNMYRQIETERLLIRPIKTSDKSFILDLLNTQGWLQFIGDRKVKDEIDAEKYIQNILDNNNFFYSVFELRNVNKPVGIITFLYRDNQKFPYIGFAILPEFDKKGYAIEATKKYLEEIATEKKVNKVIAITLPDNIKSIKLIERLGLKYEDEISDNSKILHLYSRTFVDNE
jgi:RimJ/RimL family protein N-acetyltransferase